MNNVKVSGLAAAPVNAHPSVLECAGFIAKHNGGNGAVRELVDAVLTARIANPKRNSA